MAEGTVQGQIPKLPPHAMGQAEPIQNTPIQHQLPTQLISEATTALGNPDVNLLNKLPETGKLLAGVLGLPQQALFGGQIPGNIPALRDAFTFGGIFDAERAAVLANVVLDPLNLAFVNTNTAGHLAQAELSSARVKNALRNEQAYQFYRGRGDLNDMSLVAENPKYLSELKKRAGTDVPITRLYETTNYRLPIEGIRDRDLKYWLEDKGIIGEMSLGRDKEIAARDRRDLYKQIKSDPMFKSRKVNLPELVADERTVGFGYDFSKVSDADGTIVKLKQALNEGSISYVPSDRDIFTGKLDANTQIESKTLNMFKAWWFSPKNATPFIKQGTEILNAANESFAVDRSKHHERFGPIFDDVKPNSALDRALHMAVDFVPAELWDDAAKQAMHSYGANEFTTKVDAFHKNLKMFVDDTGLKVDGNITPQNILASRRGTMDLSDNGDLFLPGAYVDLLSGTRPDVKGYSAHEATQYLLNKTLKDVHYKPSAAAMDDLMYSIKPTKVETEYMQSMKRRFLGAPDSADVWFNKVISDHKSWFEEQKPLNTMIKALSDSMAGADVTKLAALNQPTASRILRNVRSSIYAGMLGGALDSGIRNTTQLLNTITEHGFGPTLRSAGIYLTNPEIRKLFKDRQIIERTSSLATEFLEHATLGKHTTWMEAIMTPMGMAESFNRGTTFMAALDDGMNHQGMKITEAMDYAIDNTRKLQFGYSMFDVSPLQHNNAIISSPAVNKLLLQFMNFPIKQTELMANWFRQPDKTYGRKIFRYIVLTGAVINAANKLGVDAKDIIGFGFGIKPYPPYINFDPAGVLPPGVNILDSAPIVRASQEAFAMGKEFLTLISTGILGSPQTDPQEVPAKMWRHFASLLRFGAGAVAYPLLAKKLGQQGADKVAAMTVLFSGRYAQKTVALGMEQWLNNDPNARAEWLASPSGIATQSAFGIKMDPSINWQDRLIRGLGFKSKRDTDKRAFVQFIKSFSKRYHQAVHELNVAAANGGDTTELQAKWKENFENWYGGTMERFNVPITTVLNGIRPSPQAYFGRIKGIVTSSAVDRSLVGLPKPIRSTFELTPKLEEANEY